MKVHLNLLFNLFILQMGNLGTGKKNDFKK